MLSIGATWAGRVFFFLVVAASVWFPSHAQAANVGWGVSIGGGNWGLSVGGGSGAYGGYGAYGGGYGAYSSASGGSFLAPVSNFANMEGLSQAPISYIIMAVMSWLLVIVGFLGVAAFVIAGIFYLISAGDEDLMDRGKTYMKAAFTGIVVALIGVIVIRAIDAILNASPF